MHFLSDFKHFDVENFKNNYIFYSCNVLFCKKHEIFGISNIFSAACLISQQIQWVIVQYLIKFK